MECQSMTGKWQSTSVNEEKMKGQRDWGSSKRLRRDWGVSSSDWLQNTWRQDQDHGYQGPGGDGSLLLIPQETHQFFSWGKQGCPGEGPPPPFPVFVCLWCAWICVEAQGWWRASALTDLPQDSWRQGHWSRPRLANLHLSRLELEANAATILVHVHSGVLNAGPLVCIAKS